MEKLEHANASIRAKVEHPFHAVKNLFMHRKTRYKGMAKNNAQMFSLFGHPTCCWLAGSYVALTA